MLQLQRLIVNKQQKGTKLEKLYIILVYLWFTISHGDTAVECLVMCIPPTSNKWQDQTVEPAVTKDLL